MKKYIKVCLVVVWDEEHEPHPKKWDFGELLGSEITPISFEEVAKPASESAPIEMIEASMLRPGMSVKHPEKGDILIKTISDGIGSTIRVEFTTTDGEVHLSMIGRKIKYQKLSEVKKTIRKRTSRAKKTVDSAEDQPKIAEG